MSNLTYQPNNTTGLERFEWDQTWIDNAPDKETDRVFVIGDSISVGYRDIISQIANGRFRVDGVATSKGADNPAFPALVDYVLSQVEISNVKMILLNNGLHGWHLCPEDYEKHYTALVEYILKKYEGIQLALISTTPTRNKENLLLPSHRYENVIERNEIIRRIAEKHALPIFDAFSIIDGRPELHKEGDGVHLVAEGCSLIANACYEFISARI